MIETLLANFNIIELMIGTALALSFNDIIKYVVDSVIFPVIGIIIAKENLESLSFTIRNQKIRVGLLLSAIVKFLIIIYILYVLYKKFFNTLIDKIIKIRGKDDQQIINQLKLLNKKKAEERQKIRPYNYY